MTSAGTFPWGTARDCALAALLAGSLWLAPGTARAQQDELKDVERALREDRTRAESLSRQAEMLGGEIQVLQAESVSIAREAQDHETRLSAMEARLEDMEGQESAKVKILTARRVQLGQTLAALQRIALQPSDALLLSPTSPLDTVRSALLLRAAVPAIEGRAAMLREELRDLGALRVQIAAQRGQLTETALALAADRERLERLIERKSETRAAAAAGQEAAQGRAARLAARAEDLRDLMEKVAREAAEQAAREAKQRAVREQAAREAKAREAQAREAQAREAQAREAREREAVARNSVVAAPRNSVVAAPRNSVVAAPPAGPPAAQAPPAGAPASGDQVALAQPPNIRPFPSSGQSLIMPARGQTKIHFGQTQGDGRASRGIVIAARKGAQVVAPYDGKVVYAGVFRSYGQILIIEHGGRYHTLLAGLDRIDAVIGQWLLAGEPVGMLGSPGGREPELYLELRHAGQPINPLPWLATTGDKVRS